MARDRYGEEIEPPDPPKPPKDWPKCCLCRNPVDKAGWCASCRAWPINVTPLRWDDRGHRVQVDGWCASCHAFVATRLEPEAGEWRDTGDTSARVSRDQFAGLVSKAVQRLAGAGWPEIEVPLRRDHIPRHWKRLTLTTVDTTPLGHDVVVPEREGASTADQDVPF